MFMDRVAQMAAVLTASALSACTVDTALDAEASVASTEQAMSSTFGMGFVWAQTYSSSFFLIC